MTIAGVVLAIVLVLGVFATPPSTPAQGAGTRHRVGVLCSISCATSDVNAFRETLSTLGHREGSGIAFEFRSANGQLERLPGLASDLVKSNVDVIFTTWGTGAAVAAKRPTASIPIVVGSAGDLVAAGLVSSMNRPGGNVTGVSSLALEIEGKRLQLLKELMPSALRVAVFRDSANAYSALAMKEQRGAAERLGLKLRELQVGHARDVDEAFATIVTERLKALSIHGYVPVLASRERIIELAARHRIVTIYPVRDFASAGGLLSYGAT